MLVCEISTYAGFVFSFLHMFVPIAEQRGEMKEINISAISLICVSMNKQAEV